MEITGEDAEAFAIVSPALTTPLAPGATREVSVAFEPHSVGEKLAYLTITSTDLDEPSVASSLRGVGTDVGLRILAAPSQIAHGYFGTVTSGIPDTNGDGLAEIGVIGSGYIYVFDALAGELLHTFTSPNDEDGFLGSVSGIADMNGYGDVIGGGNSEDPGPAPEHAGRAYLFAGTSGEVLHALSSPYEQESGGFGGEVSGIDDVNGDGISNIIVGAAGEAPGTEYDHAGRVYLFDGFGGQLLHTFVSPNKEAWGYFGASIAGLPDVNGDSRGDVLVGARRENPGASPADAGRVYIFDGWHGTLLATLASPNERIGSFFGNSVSGIPDLDGDRRGDLGVGAFKEFPVGSPVNAGRAYIFSGSGAIPLHELVSPSEQEDGFFGVSVSGIPDVNGDGFGDVLVGAENETSPGGPEEAGRAYIFDGHTGGLLSVLISPNEESEGHFGCSVSGIPDANGDGLGDVVVGAEDENPAGSPTDAGRAYVFFSPFANYPAPTPTPTDTPSSTCTPLPTATMNPRSDISENGVVGVEDLLRLLLDWQKPTEP